MPRRKNNLMPERRAKEAAPAPKPAQHIDYLAWVALLGLLLLLALRLTITESTRETLSEVRAALFAKDPGSATPQPGPDFTITAATITLGIAALAAWNRRITRTGWLTLVLIAAVITLAFASAASAPSGKFFALVGAFDLGSALVAGWAVGVVCTTDLRRRFVLAMVIAILAAWTTKGLYQIGVENPDTREFYQAHKEEIWKEHNWSAGDPQIKLFESRMNSNEVTGFVTFSNVVGEGMVPMVLLVAALAFFVSLAPRSPNDEIPASLLLAIVLALLAAAGELVLVLTQSKGANSILILCAMISAVVYANRLWARANWRTIVITTYAILALGALAILAYGIRHDALPSRSLLFRWHYWTATVPMIQARPILGIGLNNYGDYYTAYKRLYAPEDVKDPHSFIVRLAAEIGLPGMVLAVILVAVLLLTSARTAAKALPEEEHRTPAIPLIGVGLIVLWWLIRYPIAEPFDGSFFVILTLIYTLVSAAGFFLSWHAMQLASRTWPLVLAGVIGALGMFVYDQVNMAIVTGPVAMFFWILLNTSGANSTAHTLHNRWPGRLISGTLAITTLLSLTLIVLPTLGRSFACDPRPQTAELVKAIAQRDNQRGYDLATALLEKVPRSIEYLQWKINFGGACDRPVADDMRRALLLDRTSISMRLDYAYRPSDLPPAERLNALQQAITIDNLLEKDEPKHLKPAERQTALDRITQLQAQLHKSP